MKNLSEFEISLLDSSESVKKLGLAALENMGKLIATIVAVIMIAVTFTDISFSAFSPKEMASSLLLLLTSSYIIYFSLEDAGEKFGEKSEEYKSALSRYDELRGKIKGEDIEALRGFLCKYAENELSFRKKSALMAEGLSLQDIDSYKNGETTDLRTRRKLRRISRIKPVILTPKTLLCRERWQKRSELENPERRKILGLLLKLIPSTVCMTVTVSVMLTAKDGLSTADILNGILKLSSLPMAAFRGYSAGYVYSKNSLSLWLETKANIIESFIKSSTENSGNNPT